jgi:hypothetical protein
MNSPSTEASVDISVNHTCLSLEANRQLTHFITRDSAGEFIRLQGHKVRART